MRPAVARLTLIMRYYKYPTRGTGEKTCTVKGIELSANFGETTYDWDNMLAYYKRKRIRTSHRRRQRSVVQWLSPASRR